MEKIDYRKDNFGGINMREEKIKKWLENLKKYWLEKNIEGAVSLFEHTTFYQETPFMEPFTTIEEIKEEWQHVQNEQIESIEIILLVCQENRAIAEWKLKQNGICYDGIYEIKFDNDYNCIYFKSWEMEEPQIPKSVLEYGFDFDWNEEEVWKLNYEKEEMDIQKLEWHFDVPFWNLNGNWYTLTPRSVMNHPETFKKEYERVMGADISYPIDVMENKGRFVILDGLHRLVKCKLLGMKEVTVRIIPRSEIENISK